MSRSAKTSLLPERKLLGIGHYHQPHGRHPNPVVIKKGLQIVELVTYGRGWLQMQGGEWQEVLPGALLWHIEGEYTIGRSDFDDPYHCLAMRMEVSPENAPRPAPRISWWNDLDAVRTFTHEVVSSYTMERASAQITLNYVLARLLFQVEQYQRQSSSLSMPAQLQRVIRHIEQRYGENLLLKDMAEIAEWSVPQLHKTFREHLQQSPHQWILKRRVQAARERLANTNQPIKSIATDCGFYSAAAFCAHFKRATGTTPNAYRKKMTRS